MAGTGVVGPTGVIVVAEPDWKPPQVKLFPAELTKFTATAVPLFALSSEY